MSNVHGGEAHAEKATDVAGVPLPCFPPRNIARVEQWRQLREAHTITEDAAILALNKPTGIAVTGERHDTDLVRMAADAGEYLYPAHRIDKATSGLVLFAKDMRHHGPLTRQFNKQTVDKRYLAIVSGGTAAHGVIDMPLSVGRKNRVRVAAARGTIMREGLRWFVPEVDQFTQVRTYPSVTEFTQLWTDGDSSVLAVRPVSGRRHQIRVHLAWIGHAIIGDPLFDKHAGTRARLHSFRLALRAAWRDDRRLDLEALPGADFWGELDALDTAALIREARDRPL